MELTDQQKAMLAAAASLAQATGVAAGGPIGVGITAAVTILNGVLTKGADYTMDDFNTAVAADAVVEAQEIDAENAADKRNAATPK